MWRQDTTVNNITYQILTLPETPSNIEITGYPSLPTINKLVAIPNQTDVSVDTIETNAVTFPNFFVFPYQEPVFESEHPRPFVIDTTAYSLDGFYPGETNWISGPVIWRDLRIVKLIGYPIFFNPVQHQIKVFKEMAIQLTYNGTNLHNALIGGPYQPSPTWAAMYSSAVVNYSSILWAPPPSDYYNVEGYLILCAHGYYQKIKDLKLDFWKTQKGYFCGVKDLNDIVQNCDADTQAIKDYITLVYNTHFISPDEPNLHARLTHVLFVGDPTPPEYGWQIASPKCNDWQIPPYTSWKEWHGVHFPTDYWYSLIAGSDSFPDIAVGRLCPSGDSYYGTVFLEDMLKKTLGYEKNVRADWNASKVLLVASEDENDGNHYTSFSEKLHSEILEPAGIPVEKTYAPLATAYDIKYAIEYSEEGLRWLGVVNYRGHGCEQSWESPYFNTTNVNTLANSFEWGGCPIIFNSCCGSGSMMSSGKRLQSWSMSIAWLRSNGAAVGSYGSCSGSSTYTTANDTAEYNIFNSLYHGFDVGWAINNAAVRLILYAAKQPVGLPKSHWVSTAFGYWWHGDPSLRVWVNNPSAALAYHYPVTIPPNTPIDFTVVVGTQPIPPEVGVPVGNAFVCLYKPNEAHYTGVTDCITGSVIFHGFKCPTQGWLYITVTKQGSSACCASDES